MTTPTTTDHLAPHHMAHAQRHLVAKTLAEASHERMIAPETVDGDPGLFRLDTGRSVWTFRARVLALEHWVVDPVTIQRGVDGRSAPLDAQALVTELAEQFGIPEDLLPVYLEEIAATLAGIAWKREHSRLTATDLLDADLQQTEAAMTEGHPGFIANNGRIGFGAGDHAAYSPEAGRPVRLVWVAARRELTHLALGEGLTEEGHYAAELGDAWLETAHRHLSGLGLDPADYLLMPVHPWQWDHKLAISFAPDVARRDLVLLGEGPDEHQAQQSIRTFWNLTDPTRSYTKVALSIQNMGFVRGLSPAYMRATPAINDWVAGLVHGEDELRERGFTVLRERAAIGYTGDAWHALDQPSAWSRMTAALWRESPLDRIGDGERLVTMASLLHRDADGVSSVGAMVRASGVVPRAWVRSWLDAYVRPVVHCLARWHLAFMPHGENLVLVLRDHVPVRAIMKDVGEEVAVIGPLPPDVELPDACSRVMADCPPEERSLALHTDVFDGVLRHVAGILDTDGILAEDDFWDEVAACIADHADDHPELAAALADYDFARPRWSHSCLNRLQLRNTREMVDLSDQASSLIHAGTMANPIADRVRGGLSATA